ncbi:Oidioi.mRNA.OKI2018_I69.XSR.g15766.t1.cds [Oikopleura dioica]|uniref:Oidioi.mRNA.OKI2018_I69.XSR.g15766.t1.cds n=1 Tax=Oikopleura dioica TaxID=34765 RepID=A0ABN7SK99_OIKDI|nr:Oidioi.mRNA.OKI2018_I69.XSR.g15766.t1.cds [Oikopleura dioica]
MYLCYHLPSKFGYEDISEFTRQTLDQPWIRNLGIDVDHHLPKEGEESEPPKFMQVLMKYSPVKIPDQYLTKKFLIDLAATWVIYEFIIAPVKWPYYFIATNYAVKGLRRAGLLKQLK